MPSGPKVAPPPCGAGAEGGGSNPVRWLLRAEKACNTLLLGLAVCVPLQNRAPHFLASLIGLTCPPIRQIRKKKTKNANNFSSRQSLWERPGATNVQTMHGRSGASVGDIVLLSRDDQTTMAIVAAFDARTYTLVPYVGGVPRQRLLQTTNTQWAINIATPDGNDGWVNAALPQCCVCLDAAADHALACRCTVPCVCVGCARKERMDRCPQCRHPVAPHPYGPHHIFANLYAVEPSNCQPYITVFAKTTSGGTMTLRVRQEWTVRTVKVMLWIEKRIPVDQQRLSFACRPMSDAQTLADLGVKDCATLHIVLRLMGD